LGNPFKYGKIVSGNDFADREKETKQLVEDLKSGQNVLLYSPRRYGKTSLILRALDLLKQSDVLTSYIDLYGCVTVSDLVDKLIQGPYCPHKERYKKLEIF